MQALVIDDSRALRMLISRILRDQGFEVYDAANGEEGLAQLRANPDVGLVLVDWNMPVMDGLQFIQEVRREPEWAGIRLMMVTTENESDQVQRAISAGADEYLMKPFTAEVLVAKLTMLGVREEG
jgi:two-component system chemotaxis response regulator CheY